MNNILYQNNNDFFMLDYSPSHSELALRYIDKKNQSNIDIFFKGVQYIDIIPKLSGVKIFEENNSTLLHEYGVKNSRHYSIQDNHGRHFAIISYFFCISSNKLDILQSSLGNFFWSAENKIFFDSTSNVS
jgi:hypothetical protein